MHEAREAHLRDEVKQITIKGKAVRRQLNSKAACLFKRSGVLAELKRKRDEKDADFSKKPFSVRYRGVGSCR